ncbi:MAG TPA: LD-carboxypeptidase [Casimicrobiaceae bacterium]
MLDRHWHFGIYAPAGFATDPAAVDRAIARLTALGHRVHVDSTARTREQRFSAGDDERLAAIMRMAEASDIDIAIAVRGGYGWTRLLDRIDYLALATKRMRWLGHSDFTAFQLAALARSGMITFAGPMAAYDFGAEQPSAFTFEQCFGVLDNATWEIECALDGPSQTIANGVLWGGNLSLVAHLVGTPYLPNVEGGVLFLEDVAEHPYRIERLLYQLLHAGILERQRAVLLGAFTEYQLTANDEGYDLAAAIDHLRMRAQVPIYTGLPYGHVRDKLTLPVGGRCALETRDGMARLTLSQY